MKRVKLLLLTLVTSITLTSCVVQDTDFSLNEYISSYDLWYIDYHRTTGNGDVSFLSKAFTVSFLNGTMYANNNIVDIGKTGNGLGIAVGDYVPRGTVLETYHDLDGNYNFEVVQLADDEIRIDDLSQNVSYYLIGYQRNNFNYDKLFNDNIEYFLQEYVAWERTEESGGTPNAFDDEHFLQFTPENDVTFYSSHDAFGTNIDYINWDYEGGYQIDNISGFNNLKLLTLNYDGGDTEEFELSVINDERIQLFHLSSETTYTFSGRGFVQYLKKENKSITKSTVRNSNRKRTKIQRKTVDRKHLK
ncbi:hypothetical protein BA195_02170 [Tenacibaculum soleae]|uniref:Nicotinic acid mononucleotide adenyltransferase n=1 Tax=Tenacibaculum soleae TaxID=447689 RepID=A0A1B9Y198_9FLAO|nr:hypothetical protein [Tenacibaculum soleae]OCK43529.1 hypothetical protein BA195_02170 [Tenacibaculum soleae]